MLGIVAILFTPVVLKLGYYALAVPLVFRAVGFVMGMENLTLKNALKQDFGNIVLTAIVLLIGMPVPWSAG